MSGNDLLTSISRILKHKEKPVDFIRFLDSSGNFEFYYPKGWRFDHDIAIEDARYTVSFCSPDSQSTFTVAVDANLPSDFKFNKYAKSELESPSSGIYTKAMKGRFHEMPAYNRDFTYVSGGKRQFGGGVMFCTGKVVFSLSWNAPESKKERMDQMFSHMMESFRVLEGFAMCPPFRKGPGLNHG